MRNSVLCYLEDTVKKFPDRIALTDGEFHITFQRWKDMAVSLAGEISIRIASRHQPILVYLPKSAMTLVSFAGVLYSGNYYTPTDIRFPFAKTKSVLDSLNPALVISDKNCASKLIKNGISEKNILYIEDVDFDEHKHKAESKELCRKIIDSDLAYVFFTSGSTGKPKGVSITQRSIIDYIDWAAEEFKIDENTNIVNQAPFYFDNSILDVYLCMSKGAHLHVVPETYFTFLPSLLEYIRDNSINFLFWVPSALIAVANSGLLEEIDCSCLKKVLFCGEVMPNRHLNIWRKILPDVMYANLYGPTEITDVCCYYVIDREFSDDDPLPIGNACNNTDILLLDDNNHLIEAADTIGELCVRGTCLATGYFDNPDKTRDAFVQNPLHTHYEEKIYRTGDLAHYNEFGEIMFDGRKDFQIKHLGYRIELGEIETAVLSLKEIKNGCVLYNTEKKEITLFYTGDNVADKKYIRKKLMEILPQYMIPTVFIKLEGMPMNDNGKIDRPKLRSDYF